MDVAKALRFSFVAPVLSSLLTACGYDLTGSSTPTYEKPSPQCESAAIPGQYIIRWKNGTHSVEKTSSYERLRRSLAAAKADQIDFIEPNYRVRIQGARSQSIVRAAFGSTEPIDNWGQMKIGADQAWAIAKGDGVIVAVVDAGIEVTHKQLRNQIAYNTAEVPSNGIDDDHNGLIDDYAGYDFGAGNGKVHDAPKSTHHGSHVSGIILAEHMSDGTGIQGIAPGAKLLPLPFMDDSGSGSTSDAIDAIHYAVSRGAKIVNASWGAEVCSNNLKEAIASLEAKGVLFVAAAGNGDSVNIGYNLDYRKSYPAAYPFSGQITVGAMDESGVMTGFSNYSRSLVHLLAPGLDIWSTVHDDGTSLNHGYEKMDGTSMATPFVSGAAAVLWSYRPNATVQQIKAAITASVNPGNYVVVSGGSLNLRQALDELARIVAP